MLVKSGQSTVVRMGIRTLATATTTAPPITIVQTKDQAVWGVDTYNDAFQGVIDNIKEKGNYRIFADLERQKDKFPKTIFHDQEKGVTREVTGWCSNDYLCMGQHPVVLDAMHTTLDKSGAGSGGTCLYYCLACASLHLPGPPTCHFGGSQHMCYRETDLICVFSATVQCVTAFVSRKSQVGVQQCSQEYIDMRLLDVMLEPL